MPRCGVCGGRSGCLDEDGNCRDCFAIYWGFIALTQMSWRRRLRHLWWALGGWNLWGGNQ